MSLEKEWLEERKAKVLIKLRNYKRIKEERSENAISILIEMPKDKKTGVIWCIPKESTVGIAFINRLQKTMTEKQLDRGIIITSGRYTHAAKKNAKKKNIELIPSTFPDFDIFKHKLVPKHEIATLDERKQLLQHFKVKPYQLPHIKSSDPPVKAIGAKPGDILRITRDSPTAGKHVAYRYVVK